MTHVTSTIEHKFKYKDQQSLLHINGAVYQLSCSCGEIYKRETVKKKSKFRLNEQKSFNSCKSDVSKHLLKNPSHQTDFKGVVLKGLLHKFAKN